MKGVLSGSLCDWGDSMISWFTQVIFQSLSRQTRLHCLRLREVRRYGDQILEGGSRHADSTAFLAWAARYHGSNHSLCSACRHERWLKPLKCPVIRLDTTHHSVEGLMSQLMTLLNP
jgi:hypothetical protein